jgi:hypothetical protein
MCWQCGRPIPQRFPRRARRFAAAIAAGLADSAAIMTLAELTRAFRKVNYPRSSVTRAVAGAGGQLVARPQVSAKVDRRYLLLRHRSP